MIDECFYSDGVGINDCPDNEGYSPERCLMVGMLSRAYFDLISSGDGPKNRRDAIKWFQNKDRDYILSYYNIKLHLSLSVKLLKHLDMTLNRAIELDEEERNVAKQSEGKACRKGARKLDEGARDSFRPQVPTVFW